MAKYTTTRTTTAPVTINATNVATALSEGGTLHTMLATMDVAAFPFPDATTLVHTGNWQQFHWDNGKSGAAHRDGDEWRPEFVAVDTNGNAVGTPACLSLRTLRTRSVQQFDASALTLRSAFVESATFADIITALANGAGTVQYTVRNTVIWTKVGNTLQSRFHGLRHVAVPNGLHIADTAE